MRNIELLLVTFGSESFSTGEFITLKSSLVPSIEISFSKMKINNNEKGDR